MNRAFWCQNIFNFNNPCRLVPKYFEYFIGSAPPLFILDPLSGWDQTYFLCT